MQRRISVLILMLICLVPAAARGASSSGQAPRPRGTLEWELGAIWWVSEFYLAGTDISYGENDAGALGFHGEIWLPQHFGFVGQYLPTDTSGTASGAADVTYGSLDALYRVDTVGKNNYVAIGAGWEYADLAVSDAFGDTNGPRGVIAVRMGSAKAFGYGEYSYMWKMSRINVQDDLDEDLRNIRGDEYEFGGGVVLGDHVQFRLGYRHIEFRMDRADGNSYTADSGGYLAALSVVF